MESMPNRKATKPTDVLIVRADERPPAYQQIARADYQRIAAEEQSTSVTKYTLKAIESDDVLIARFDEQFARMTERLSRLERDAARHRSAVADHLSSRGRPALRGLIGLLAACIFAGALVSQSSYGDATKLMLTRWAPLLVAAPPLPQKEPGLAVSSSDDRVAASEPMSPQPTPSASREVAPTIAPLSSELAQLHEMRARDLADMEQVIEQLKARQDQMARDHANAFEQLKANQEQMARDHAEAIDQLKMSQQQMARDTAKLVEQLKTSQEQLARDTATVAEQLKVSLDQTASFIAKPAGPSRRPKTSAPPPRPIAPPTR
jgi:hypothetical protein